MSRSVGPPTPPPEVAVDEKCLEELFNRILRIVRSREIFHKSPTFFVVYAHDNDSGLAANSGVVLDFIRWFKEAGCRISSDATPPATREVTEGQFCLLPYGAYPRRSVELVLLCGSDLLGDYMKKDKFNEFEDEMVVQYTQGRAENKSEEDIHKIVCDLQQKFCELMGDDFHHVQTEIALLKARVKFGEKNSIIPFLLNGNLKNFPSFITDGQDSLRTVLGPELGKDGSKYVCFLEVLEKLTHRPSHARRPADLIRDMRDIYGKAVDELKKPGSNPKALVENYRDKANTASNKWTDNQRSSSNGVDAGDVREALEKYTEPLSVQTVLGQKLPICKHHIKLEVVESSISGTQSSRSSCVGLTELFKERKLKNGQIDRPKRILIQGRPGIGKSTLCKQILHEYSKQLGIIFRWVLWVPLRSFEQAENLEMFIKNEYFPNEPKRDDLSKVLYQRIFEEDRKHTLLILDGWDEVRSWKADKANRIFELAAYDNVVITSRSSGWDSGCGVSVDLELNAIGFDDGTIVEYFENEEILGSKAMVEEFATFIRDNPSIWELVQVPMHLDLLCSSWDQLRSKIQSGSIPTITMLYQTMVTRLWCKDYAGFKESRCDERQAKRLSEHVLLGNVQPESDCLGELAIGLVNERKMGFDDRCIDSVAQGVDPEGNHTWLTENVKNVSFLRSNGPNQQPNYTFIHLTFQEFFAAQWLTKNSSSLLSYIQKYKYDARSETILRFVAGLLAVSGTESELSSFFKNLEKEPLDLLGPVHQRLVIHCLSQTASVQQGSFINMRKKLEECLKNWLLFECNWGNCSRLAAEYEFPEEVLMAVLKSPSVNEDTKTKVLVSLRARSNLSPKLIEQVASSMNGNMSKDFKTAALKMFLSPYRALPDNIIEEMVKQLDDSNEDVRLAALDALGEQSKLPKDICKAIAARFNDPKPEIRLHAVHALGHHTLTNENLDKMEALLKDSEGFVKGAAVVALRQQKDLPPRIKNAIATVLQDPADNAKDYIPTVIVWDEVQPLSREELSAKVRKLTDTNSETRRTAAHALSEQPNLPPDILQAMVKFMADPEWQIRNAVVQALGKEPYLPQEILTVIMEQMKNPESGIRYASLQILGKQADLSKTILTDMAALLKDVDEFVQHAAVDALCPQPGLSSETLEAITAILKGPDVDMKRIAVRGLGQQTHLSSGTLDAMATLLKDSDCNIKWAVIQSLDKQVYLPNEILKAVAAQLEYPDEGMKSGVADTIIKWSATVVGCESLITDGQFFTNFYGAWLWRSFTEPLTWFLEDSTLYMQGLPVGLMSSLFGRATSAVQYAKKSLKLPATVCLEQETI
ncbi:hypothetical protein AJ80_00457 [Polytolypa hystricis UAMH7299]|uniref:NACHT domain-containing protein n=1 Tax=Polytolypa hystricis (strain UAMH7299) TaxID=1447883 RepID=A0A2B7Z4Y5_POLH7|nr:hypothetical protein AJ80_00457 [Polytolypa hystricis UAMH7299]